ncbi:MAG: TIGR02301 family protein [Bosea sp.]|nr:TIGR02301 family protein [Bosea sp. (in: a-proteobacteria)]
MRRILAALSLAAAVVLPPPAALAADPPYDAALVRLSEILGALHYLGPLCGVAKPGEWRDQMEALLAAETPSPERQARLTEAFNGGYQGFAALYRRCTPSAELAIERYRAEGSKLTREVTTRYGGDASPPR